jgi:VWFA-related protein
MPIECRHGGLAPTAGPILVAAATAFGMTVLAAPVDQQATFRSAVDLIAVDVQVIDDDGRPVGQLSPDHFEVSIDGRRRRVASADYIESVPVHKLSPIAPGATARNVWPTGPPPALEPTGPSRLFMMATDAESLAIGTARRMMQAARAFLDRLQPNDMVGLFTFPTGPVINPTTDHQAIATGLTNTIGQRPQLPNRFNLSPSELIDIMADVSSAAANLPTESNMFTVSETTEAIARVQQRECPDDITCPLKIRQEAADLALHLEGVATQSMSSLRRLISAMGRVPGRKTLVLLSGGFVVGDRPGGRPDIGQLASVMGLEAARANTALYVLHIDTSFLDMYSADTGRADSFTSSRDTQVSRSWLDEFSSSSGGALFRVTSGAGEYAFDRVLRETSAYYLLGVEPAESDRDGRTHTLKVRVRRDNSTVRNRTVVVIPRRPTA